MNIRSTWKCLLGVVTLTTLTPFAAFGFGHGPLATIDSFVRADTEVYVSRSLPSEAILASFRVGNGTNWYVSKRALPSASKAVVGKGMLLAYVETGSEENRVHGQEIASDTRDGIHKSISILNYNEYIALQNNARAFVRVVNFSTETKAQLPKANALDFGSERFLLGDSLVVDSGMLTKHVNILSGVEPFKNDGRDTSIPERGSEGTRKLTNSYMVSYYRSLGLEADVRCYTSTFYKGCNVEATKWGRDRNKVLLVTSHLDSVRNAGADDNGTGTATVMEAARLMANLDTAVSVRFVSFDQEELGLIGSENYAKQYGRSTPQIVGVVNMDMIGYDSDNDGAIHIMDCGRQDSIPMAKRAEDVNRDLGLGLKRVSACTDRSDHASFWELNIPAIVISENFFGRDSNVCYHKACDKTDKMNMPYFFKVASLVVNTIYSLAK